MTTFKVGDRVKIGEAVARIVSWGNPVGIEWDTNNRYGKYADIARDIFDALGAVIVPKPIEWQDGDVIAQYSQSFPSSLVNISYRVGGKWYPSQPLHSQSDAHASERVNKYDWKRVKVVPYDD